MLLRLFSLKKPHLPFGAPSGIIETEITAKEGADRAFSVKKVLSPPDAHFPIP